MNQNPRLVVSCDVDGTLLDSYRDLVDSYRRTLRENFFALSLPDQPEEVWRKAWSGPGIEGVVSAAYPRLQKEQLKKVCDILKTGVKDLCIPAVEGAVGAIRRLCKAEIILCLMSSRDADLEKGMRAAGFNLDDFVVIVDGTHRHPKPDVRAFEPISRWMIQNGYSECVHVGDDELDLRFAQVIGKRFLAVTTGAMTAQDFVEFGQPRELIFLSFVEAADFLLQEVKK